MSVPLLARSSPALDAVDKTFILSPTAGYRILGSDASFLDVLGGIRFWHVKGELKFEPGILGRLDLSDSRNWVDGIFAHEGKEASITNMVSRGLW